MVEIDIQSRVFPAVVFVFAVHGFHSGSCRYDLAGYSGTEIY